MIKASNFKNYNADSSIMLKKDKAEVTSWIYELSHIHEELEYLLNIELRILKNYN